MIIISRQWGGDDEHEEDVDDRADREERERESERNKAHSAPSCDDTRQSVSLSLVSRAL